MAIADKNSMEYDEELQAISKLRLLDDDLMTLVFDRNIDATELLLNIILQRSDLKVMEVVAQREYKSPMAGGRSITIDIYAIDAAKKYMILKYKGHQQEQMSAEQGSTAA